MRSSLELLHLGKVLICMDWQFPLQTPLRNKFNSVIQKENYFIWGIQFYVKGALIFLLTYVKQAFKQKFSNKIKIVCSAQILDITSYLF